MQDILIKDLQVKGYGSILNSPIHAQLLSLDIDEPLKKIITIDNPDISLQGAIKLPISITIVIDSNEETYEVEPQDMWLWTSERGLSITIK